MITDADIQKLKGVFATKDDLNSFATKDELAKVAADVMELKVDSSLIQQTLIRMERKLDGSIEFSHKNFATLEGLSGKVADLDQENKMGSVTLRRYDVQIHELAKATGTAITE